MKTPYQKLPLPARLRLRSRFARWEKNPALFSSDIRDAERQLEESQKPGWSLSVDRHGVPVAMPPKNLRLTTQELSRIRKRLQTLTDPEEIRSGMAALAACAHRGFKASVDSEGRLIATPPKAKIKSYVTSHSEGARKNQNFTAKFMGRSCVA
jgi:hypothetical protein